jgi:phage repressor protein C with HTH and peptisase S24 domain
MTTQIAWDISQSQLLPLGIFRTSPITGERSIISHMAEALDLKAIRKRIEDEMEAKGFSKRSLSIKANLSQTAVRDVLERTENPGVGTLHKLAEALEIPPEDLFGVGRVPVTGLIGAGGQVAYFPEEQEQRYVARPPLAIGRYMALEVKGDSMLPKYEPGDIVYVRREHDGVLPEYLGKYCAIHTAEGGTYLKIISPGTEPGRYTLRSLNAADMENVEVIWAAKVEFVLQK